MCETRRPKGTHERPRPPPLAGHLSERPDQDHPAGAIEPGNVNSRLPDDASRRLDPRNLSHAAYPTGPCGAALRPTRRPPQASARRRLRESTMSIEAISWALNEAPIPT